MTARYAFPFLLAAALVMPGAAAGGETLVEAALPGRLVAYALPAGADAKRQIVLLVARPVPGQVPTEPAKDADATPAALKPAELPPCPEARESKSEPPRALYRLDPAGDGTLVPLVESLSADCSDLDAADLDGDGVEELLLACGGALFSTAAFPPENASGPSKLERLVADPELVVSRFRRRPGRRAEPSGAPVTYVTPGRLRAWGPRGGNGAPWEALGDVELPLEGDFRGNALLVTGPIPAALGRRPDGAMVFAAGPRPFGSQRLRTLLVTVAPSGEAEIAEAWSRLPAPERVLERAFLTLDGQSVLLVTTMPAGKLSLFGEKRLRLFPLRHDRTRLGLTPLFAGESGMNLWQQAVPVIADANGDGREDLVVGYWKGLKDDRVVLEAYLRGSDGALGPTAKTTAFNVEDGDRSFLHYGTDLDGDRAADLLLRAGERFWLYPGRASTTGKHLLAETPRPLPLGSTAASTEGVTIAISTGAGVIVTKDESAEAAPRFADLDGDGTPEILLAVEGGEGKGDVFRALKLGTDLFISD